MTCCSAASYLPWASYLIGKGFRQSEALSENLSAQRELACWLLNLVLGERYRAHET